MNVADPLLAYANKQTDIGFTKAVDRLHRIANQKECLARVRRPACGQFFQQGDLGWAGVLKLVHQQMADLIVQLLGQIGGCLRFAQRGEGALSDLRMVDRFLPDKGEPEVATGQLEQACQVADDRCRFLVELWFGERPDL